MESLRPLVWKVSALVSASPRVDSLCVPLVWIVFASPRVNSLNVPIVWIVSASPRANSLCISLCIPSCGGQLFTFFSVFNLVEATLAA